MIPPSFPVAVCQTLLTKMRARLDKQETGGLLMNRREVEILYRLAGEIHPWFAAGPYVHLSVVELRRILVDAERNVAEAVTHKLLR